MGALNPLDMIKDHKSILLPVAGLLVLVLGMGIFYGKNGDLLGTGQQLGEDFAGKTELTGKQYDAAPEMQISASGDYTATIQTKYGDIKVQLFAEDAPNTVNNFVFLARSGFYDGLTFHRVVKGFVIQGGDPDGDGSGGPGYNIPDEINPNALDLDKVLVKDSAFLGQLYDAYNPDAAAYSSSSLSAHANDTLASFYDTVVGYDYNYNLNSHKFEDGVIAMANTLKPNSNGSQFFITVTGSSTESLNGRHTVFGKVIDGMDIVDRISNVLTTSDGKPQTELYIQKITIEEN